MSLRPHPLETLFATLAGWLPLLGGLTLLAMTLITPEWLSWRELVWQRDMLKLQAQSLQTQAQDYATFHDALLADDPVLLERLAFTQLRYKPAGKQLMDDLWLATAAGSGQGSATAAAHPSTGLVMNEMIESWLAKPQPVVGRDIQPLRPINTRLTRLTRGLSRYALLTVAILCLLAALWPEKTRTAEELPDTVDNQPEQPRPPLHIRAA